MTEANIEVTPEVAAPVIPTTEPLPEMPDGLSAFDKAGMEDTGDSDIPENQTLDDGSESGEGDGLSAADVEVLERLLPKYKRTLKIGGEEQELTFDEMLKHAQKAGGADKRFQEAAAKEREAQLIQQNWQQFLHTLETNPVAVLKNPEAHGIPGWKAREAAEAYLTEELRKEMMDPNERRALELEEENKKLKSAQEQRERESIAAQRREMEAHYQREYDQKIQDALTTNGLPVDPETVARLANRMLGELNEGKEPDAMELAKSLKGSMQGGLIEVLQSMSDEEMAQLPKNLLDKIRKHDLSKLKQPVPDNPSAPSGASAIERVAASSSRKAGKISMDEFDARMAKIKAGMS